MEINRGHPSAYDLVFPVFGGEINDIKQFIPTEIYGTAFYIGNNMFVTCAHTINNALQHNKIVLGYADENANVNFVNISNTETFEKNDSGIICAEIKRAKALPWLRQKLVMLNDVVSSGYPYGLDNTHKETFIRSFKGYISLVGYNHRFSKSPHYELSYQIPRGLSGGPLFFVKDSSYFICGMTIGNEITEMIVSSFKEKDDKDGKITVYEKTEALHRGIAMQTESFLAIEYNFLAELFTTIYQLTIY